MDMLFKTNNLVYAIVLVSLYHVTNSQIGPLDIEVDPTHTAEPWDKDTFKEEAAQTYNLVFHKYNRHVRPPVPFVEVDLAVTLAHIRHLDLHRQELETVLNIEADWVDSRLQWIPHKLRSIHSNTSNVWVPDIVYTNGVSLVKSLYPGIVRIVSDGSVRWSRKEIVTTQCRTRPEERNQKCTIEFGFLSNSRGDNTDRFFSNRSSVTVLNDFGNHKWWLMEMNMDFDDNNDTKSTYIDINLTLRSRTDDPEEGDESTQGTSTKGKGSFQGSVENCTESDPDSEYQVNIDSGNSANQHYLNSAMLLLISIVSLWQWLRLAFTLHNGSVQR